MRTLELIPVNVALLAFIRIPWARIVARPVPQKGQLWAWVPSPLLNAFAQLASLKLGAIDAGEGVGRVLGKEKKTLKQWVKPEGFQKNGVF